MINTLIHNHLVFINLISAVHKNFAPIQVYSFPSIVLLLYKSQFYTHLIHQHGFTIIALCSFPLARGMKPLKTKSVNTGFYFYLHSSRTSALSCLTWIELLSIHCPCISTFSASSWESLLLTNALGFLFFWGYLHFSFIFKG